MQENLETTLAKLVFIPSTTLASDACHEVLEFVKDEIESLGLFIHSDTTIANPWLLATTQDTKTPDILLAAHLDVVPASGEQFIMEKRAGKLYGRGVYDMKFAAACYIELLKAHADELQDLNIGVMFTTDEEEGGQGTIDTLDLGFRPKVTLLPDGGDNWAIEKRAKGLYNVRLSATGKTAHGSRPWEGENAIATLLDAVQTLQATYPSIKPSDATLSLNKIEGGKALNQVPDHASAFLDFRSFDRQEIAAYRQQVAELAKTHNLKVTPINAGDPLLFDADNPNVQSFLHALRDFTGNDDIAYCESYGASDARYFAHHNIPCIIIQTEGGGRHADDEWIKADDLLRYYQLLEHWIFPKTA